MRISSAALTFAAILIAAPAAAKDTRLCAYTDLMPDYIAFAHRTAGETVDQRATDFVAQFAGKHPEYYAPELYGDAEKLTTRAKRFFDPASRTFGGLPPLTEENLEAVGRVAGKDFAAAQKIFVKEFPDFQCSTFVAFAPSLLRFDGHPQDFGGRSNLLFGIDMIALIHGPEDMPSFFAHEIFHLYHAQVVGADTPPGAQAGWWTMWREGLATYVSQRMNPGLNAQQVLWLPRDIDARMQKERARGARLLLADVEKTGADADRWFDAGTSVDGLPERAGYWFGYEFAKSIGDAKTLRDLARMKPADVRVAEIDFLRKEANP